MLQKVGQGQLQILSDGRFHFSAHLSPVLKGCFSRTMRYQSFLILLFGIKLVEPLHDPINAEDVLVQAQQFSCSKIWQKILNVTKKSTQKHEVTFFRSFEDRHL